MGNVDHFEARRLPERRGGNYFVEWTLHVRNQRNGQAPSLGFKSVGIQLLDVAGQPFNGTDKLYFGDGPNVETTSFFLTPPTFDEPSPEDLIWKNGLLPATTPFTEATFKMLVHLDATENFGGNGQGDFGMDSALTISTVPEPSSAFLVMVGWACSITLLRRASHRPITLATPPPTSASIVTSRSWLTLTGINLSASASRFPFLDVAKQKESHEMRNIGIESLDRRDLMAANILSDALVPPTQPANHRMFAIIDRTPLTEPTSNTVYMASAGGGVWKTTNGGYAGSHALYQDIAIPQ